MTHGTMGPQWIADEIRKADEMTDKLAERALWLANVGFGYDITDSDRVMLRALSARVAELEAERDAANEGLTAAYLAGSHDAKVRAEADEAKAAQVDALVEAATGLINDVKRRYPNEELRCEFMQAVDAANAQFKDTTT